jgi:hypothetical protein
MMERVFCETCGLEGTQVAMFVFHWRLTDEQDHAHSWLTDQGQPGWQSTEKRDPPTVRKIPSLDLSESAERPIAVLFGLLAAAAPVVIVWMIVNGDFRAIHVSLAYLVGMLTAIRVFQLMSDQLNIPRWRPILFLIPVLGGIDLARMMFKLSAIPRKDRG